MSAHARQLEGRGEEGRHAFDHHDLRLEAASWYESMGIMVVWMAVGDTTGHDPFTTPVDTQGMLTHGHLPRTTTTAARPTRRTTPT